MSSIAYVTDEKMLEYHRLCRNKDILFWRLSSRKKFTDFRKGDLLFFFARPLKPRPVMIPVNCSAKRLPKLPRVRFPSR